MENFISPLFVRTFRKAYELESFTQTAAILGMTQSGVSQHVANIEEILCAPLFERIGRSIKSTRVGKKFYIESGVWLAQMNNLVIDIQREEKLFKGHVSIGAPGSFGVYLLPHLLKWQKKYSEITLNFEYGPSSIMDRELRVGHLDLAISSEILDSRFFVSEKLYDQEFVLVSPPKMKVNLASWEEFSKTPMVNYPGSEAIFQPWLMAHFKKHVTDFHQLNFRAKVNNMESIFMMLENGVGASVFPKDPLIDLIQKNKLVINKTGKTILHPIYLVQRQGQIFSRKLEALKELIIRVVAELKTE